jgi:hypothetical protein
MFHHTALQARLSAAGGDLVSSLSAAASGRTLKDQSRDRSDLDRIRENILVSPVGSIKLQGYDGESIYEKHEQVALRVVGGCSCFVSCTEGVVSALVKLIAGSISCDIVIWSRSALHDLEIMGFLHHGPARGI